MKPASHTLAAALILFVWPTAILQAAYFTNRDDFLSAITGSNYTESFDSITVDTPLTPPLSFSNSGFSFNATTKSGDDLYGLATAAPDRWLATYTDGESLLFTNFSLNTTAFGGYFFNTDNNGSQTTFNLTLQAVGDGATNTQIVTPASASNFFGWTFGTGIASVTITSTNY